MKVYAWMDDFIVHVSAQSRPFASCQIELDEGLFRTYDSINAAFWAMQDYLENLYHEEMERKKQATLDKPYRVRYDEGGYSNEGDDVKY